LAKAQRKKNEKGVLVVAKTLHAMDRGKHTVKASNFGLHGNFGPLFQEDVL
jgi:hypothetical protein